MRKFLSYLAASPLFAGIHEDEAESMLSCLEAKFREFDKNAYILRAGSRAESIGILLTGSAYIIQEDFWGNRNMIAQITPGQVFAEAFACAFHSRVIRNLLSDLARKNLRFNEKLTHMTQRTTREKLLSYLSAYSLREGSSSFDIPFNRQQLADYLSVDRSAMSNELCRLRDEGILRFTRSHFELLRKHSL